MLHIFHQSPSSSINSAFENWRRTTLTLFLHLSPSPSLSPSRSLRVCLSRSLFLSLHTEPASGANLNAECNACQDIVCPGGADAVWFHKKVNIVSDSNRRVFANGTLRLCLPLEQRQVGLGEHCMHARTHASPPPPHTHTHTQTNTCT